MWITALVSLEEHNYVGKFILKLFYKRMEIEIYIISIRYILKLSLTEKVMQKLDLF